MSTCLDLEHAETRVIHELVDFTDRDVLDVGCGEGRMTWRFAQPARSVLGLDPTAAAIETARRAVPTGLGAKVRFQMADITTIQLPQAAFDVVAFSWSLC
jgi:ubiquinone/menaquinone biosynthesis C-methylase UbiE